MGQILQLYNKSNEINQYYVSFCTINAKYGNIVVGGDDCAAVIYAMSMNLYIFFIHLKVMF